MALAALAAGSAVHWVLKWPVAAVPVATVDAPAAATVDTLAVARALGGGAGPVAAAVAPASSRFSLAGVVAGGEHRGAALIAVDGKPAKPYRVGAVVGAQWVLQSVEPRRVVLAPQGSSADASIALELPPKKQ